MIFKEFNIRILCKGDKYRFVSDKADLKVTTITAPYDFDGVIGTIEFAYNKVIFHPPNGNDLTLSAKKFYETFLKGE